MEWYKILMEIVAGLGGLAGVGAFIKIFMFAKQEKAGKNIENEGKKVENQHNVIQDYQALLNWLQEHMKGYKQEVDIHVAAVKIEVKELREEVQQLKRISSEAYRCKYPPTIDECPVIKAMKASKKCEECRKRGSDECIECKE